jgi:hypothetical protein
MLQEIIKLAVQKINDYKETQYIITEGTEDECPQILVKHSDKSKEIVVEDLDQITSVQITNNTIILHEEGSITIISPGNYTYHGIY